jgi:hypothetical protein
MQGEERLNPFTCKWYDITTLPTPIIGGGIEPLREEHGWIEHTGSASWFRSPEGKLTQLALAGKSIGTVRPQKFSHSVHKYIFWRGSINRTLLIDTAGSIEIQPQPEPPLHSGQVEPAGRNGMLLRSTQINVRAEWDVGQAGLYKFSAAQSVQKVTEGLIQAMQIHRDGCLVAVIVDPWNGRGREHVVRAFDLCR